MLLPQKSRKHTIPLRKNTIRTQIKMPKPRTSSQTHSQHMSYSPIPRKRKRGTSTVLQPSTKAPVSTQAERMLGDRLGVRLVQADFKVSAEALAPTSTSKTCSVLSQGVGREAAVLVNLPFKKKCLWGKTSKYRLTFRLWMLPKEPARTYQLTHWSNARHVPAEA